MAKNDFDPLRAGHEGDQPSEAFETTWRRGVRRRLLIVGVALALWTAGIQARLVYLQVVEHQHYREVANGQQTRVYEPAARRGDVLDRNGQVLAYSVDAETIAVNPRVLTDVPATIAALCREFGDCSRKERDSLIAGISSSRNYFAFVRRGVSPAVGARITALELPGVTVQPESRRYYPNKELAAHLLGFVGLDNQGLGGIEATYDKTISGRKGRVLMLTDALDRSVGRRVDLEPTAGATVELTIDQYLQHFAERELREGVLRHKAAGGTLVALNPNNGEIFALANYPTFNPNTPSGVDADRRRNRAVQDVYEPGSTFKIVTAAAAIEEGILSPSDIIDTAPGLIRIGARVVDDEHAYGALTFEDVIVKSSNVGAIKAGWQIGAERLNRYVHRFGFGEIHAPDFRGVSGGIVWPPEKLNDSGMASVSMGYQVAITPLQMAMATAAVANGGTLYEPRLVRAIIKDGERQDVEPKVLRRAISPATAAALTTIMEGVVERGTAKGAQLPGYQVAGKTGTTQKIINGGYSASDHVGSFTGFAPSRRPELVVIVMIDRPTEGGYYGGTVAAPIFQRFMQAALTHLGVPPTLNPATPLIANTGVSTVLPVRYTAPTAAQRPTITYVDGQMVMPDLTGLGARDATRLLTGLGLSVRVHGVGLVTSQTPSAGEPVYAGGVSHLGLERARPDPPGGGSQ